jgi:hypothetical protein
MAKKINSVEAYPGRVYTLSVPINFEITDEEITDTATYSLNLRHIRIVGISLAGIALGIMGNIQVWLLDGGTASFDFTTLRMTARHVKRMIDLPIMQTFVSNQVELTPVDIDRGLNLFIQMQSSYSSVGIRPGGGIGIGGIEGTVSTQGIFSGTLFIHYIYQP